MRKLKVNMDDFNIIQNATSIRESILRNLTTSNDNVDNECGYPTEITINDYKVMYERNGLAGRVVELFPEETWGQFPLIYETEESNETEFEKKMVALIKQSHLYSYTQELDILSGIGRYGLMLFGINDGKPLSDYVDGIDEITGVMKGNGGGEKELLYLKVFDESKITINRTCGDINSPRYGMPMSYNIIIDTGSNGETKTLVVHWTRVLHTADNRRGSELFGTPRMKKVYNQLLDIKKILGGSGQMFWNGGFPGLSFEINPDLQDVTLDEESIKEQMDAYSQGLQRYLALSGVTAKSLEPQVADPTGHLDAQVNFICVSLNVPKRIFEGSERGELSSSQDSKAWRRRIYKRQTSYATESILMPLIDRLMLMGVLPFIEEYFVFWEPDEEMTEEEKAKIIVHKTDALVKYVAGGVDSLMPPQLYLTMVMGYTEDEAAAIMKEQSGWTEDGERIEEEPLPEVNPDGTPIEQTPTSKDEKKPVKKVVVKK